MKKNLLFSGLAIAFVLIASLSFIQLPGKESKYTFDDWKLREQDTTNRSYNFAVKLARRIEDEKWTRSEVIERLGQPAPDHLHRQMPYAIEYRYGVLRFDWRGMPNTNTLVLSFGFGGDRVTSATFSED